MDVDAFSLKKGPTESGTVPTQEIKYLLMEPSPVGGEILPFNLLETLPKYWLFGVALLIPLVLLLYKKRDLALNLLSHVI
jgi:hypothetical protein